MSQSENGSEEEYSIVTYRTEDGTVFYDEERPLAWIKTDRTIDLKESI